MSGISAIICTVTLFLVIPIPETPSWLASKGRYREAEASLRFFRGLQRTNANEHPELQDEIDALLLQSKLQNARHAESVIQKLRKPEVYKPLAIMIGFFGFQQFSGILVVVVYAVKFSTAAGVHIDPFVCTILIGAVRVAASLVIGFILDRIGRRLPAMFSGFMMAVCMFGMAICVHYKLDSVSWLPVVLILTYIFTSTLGLLTLPFTMIAEVYPQRVRGLASGLTICAAFTMSFIVVKLYPTMVYELGTVAVLLCYGTVALMSVIYVYLVLPETKGKTLLEIENLFKSHDADPERSKMHASHDNHA